MAWFRGKLSFAILLLQVIFIILFAFTAKYDKDALPKSGGEHGESADNGINRFYGVFQDVNVMIFVGFGFLMTFLKQYGYGSVGFNFLLAVFAIEWSTLVRGWFVLEDGQFKIGIEQMILADFTAATVLISFGAVLGKVSPLQLLIMTFIEVVVAIINQYIGEDLLGVVDIGGSMFIHAFGAFFGLGVARVLAQDANENNAKEGSDKTSDLFSMIGTVFLWMFWPSFNGALAEDDGRHRAIINTYYSLAACCVVTFAISTLANKEGKVEMVAIQNATLAGGVAVGASANLIINPWGAILIGSCAGVVSTLGFKYCTEFLSSKLKIHDTCGVNNLHGMPGVIGGLAAAVAVTVATPELYGDSYGEIFPAFLATAEPRTTNVQTGYQLLALVITIAISVVTGMMTGFLLKLNIWDEPSDADLFDDKRYWDFLTGDTSGEARYAHLATQDVESPENAKETMELATTPEK